MRTKLRTGIVTQSACGYFCKTNNLPRELQKYFIIFTMKSSVKRESGTNCNTILKKQLRIKWPHFTGIPNPPIYSFTDYISSPKTFPELARFYLLWISKKHPNFNLCTSFMSPALDTVSLFLPDLVKKSLSCSHDEKNIVAKPSAFTERLVQIILFQPSVHWLPIIDRSIFCIFIHHVSLCMHTHGWWDKIIFHNS